MVLIHMGIDKEQLERERGSKRETQFLNRLLKIPGLLKILHTGPLKSFFVWKLTDSVQSKKSGMDKLSAG